MKLEPTDKALVLRVKLDGGECPKVGTIVGTEVGAGVGTGVGAGVINAHEWLV